MSRANLDMVSERERETVQANNFNPANAQDAPRSSACESIFLLRKVPQVDSFRRRIVRLGHISLAALGMLNVFYGRMPQTDGPIALHRMAAGGLILGGITMPRSQLVYGWAK